MSGFPTPPRDIEDGEGRDIALRVADDGDLDDLVAMYDVFDPADRAQGLPPVGESAIRTWVAGLLGAGADDGGPARAREGLNVAAWHADRVVGHATLVPDDDGHELAIFVHQEYQGAGIGTELLDTLLGYGAEQGVERVWLTVERWNRAAVAVYEKAGFEITDAESFELQMARELH
ncbi:MAG: GNAT family N-acetyltransferase [Halobacteriaceae archaeon]